MERTDGRFQNKTKVGGHSRWNANGCKQLRDGTQLRWIHGKTLQKVSTVKILNISQLMKAGRSFGRQNTVGDRGTDGVG